MFNVKSILEFTKKNHLIIVLGLLFLIIVISLSTKESFGNLDSWDMFANYPQVFTEKVATPFMKTMDLSKYFLGPKETVKPFQVDSQYLELPNSETKIPVEMGDGTVVEATVKIPAQTAVVNSQVSVKLPEHKITDKVVQNQVVVIPEQNTTIPGAINDNGDFVGVSVKIPEQQVVVPAQNAIIPATEPVASA